MELLPYRCVWCTPYNDASCHVTSRKATKPHSEMHACSTITCHLHFWQNGQDLSRATAVTRAWNGYIVNNYTLTSCQPHTVTSGRHNTGDNRLMIITSYMIIGCFFTQFVVVIIRSIIHACIALFA